MATSEHNRDELVSRLAPRVRARAAIAATWLPFALALAPAAHAQGGRATSPQRAPATPALTDYTVQDGESCGVIARRLYGDVHRVDLVHRYNPQLGPVPHHLHAGQVLHLPARADAPASTGPDARLTFVRHNVETFTPAQHPGRPNDPLTRGDRVSTEAESSAEVTFVDETQLQLAERTLVVILGDTRAQAARQATVADTTLVNGSLRLHLAALAGRPATVPIQAGTARVVMSPGEVQVQVDPANTTRLSVYQGRSQVIAQRRAVAVPQGFGSRADRGRPPRPPQRLPDAPTWVHAPPRVIFTPAGDVTLEGEYGPGAGVGPRPALWHVQLARDERFNDLIVDARVPLGTTQLSARNLPPAAYYARVSAVDADQFEGPYTARADVSVVSAAPQPVPSGPHRATIAVPRGLFCGLDGAPLAAVTGPLEIDTRQAHRLRCAGSASGDGGAEVALPAEPLGAVTARAELAQGAPAATEATVTVRLTMASGEPFWGLAMPSVEATNGVTAGPVSAVAGEPGVYRVAVRWRPGTARFALQVRVSESQVVATPELAVAAPPAPIAPPPPRPATNRWAVELAALGGVDFPTDGLAVGPHAGLELGVRYSLGATVVSLALRGAYERYGADGVPARICTAPPPTGACADGVGQPATAALTEEVVSLALPLSFRLAGPEARVIPYLALAPQLLFERSSTTEAAGVLVTHATRFAFSAHVGGQVRVGPGGIFLEVGGRFGAAPQRVSGESTTGLVELLAGYRLTF